MSISERARPVRKLCDHCPARPDRSLPQHRRLFGLCKAAFMHWPETSEFHPQNEEHLRKWLIAKAGHHTVHTIEIGDFSHTAILRVVEAAMTAAGAYAFTKSVAGKIYVFAPKSIAFDKLSHKAACKLFDEIGAVIETEMGIAPDELLKQSEAAA